MPKCQANYNGNGKGKGLHDSWWGNGAILVFFSVDFLDTWPAGYVPSQGTKLVEALGPGRASRINVFMEASSMQYSARGAEYEYIRKKRRLFPWTAEAKLKEETALF